MRSLRLLLSVCSITLSLGSAASALLINNGLAPPNPENVIDGLVTDPTLDVANQFCDPNEFGGSSCSNPSAPPTTVAIVDGGVASNVLVYQTSHVDMSGGNVFGFLSATNDASIIMSGGSVDFLEASLNSSVQLLGGHVDVQVRADGTAHLVIAGGTITDSTLAEIRTLGPGLIEILGSGFAIDGIRVGFGDVTALTGRLTGRLSSGEPIDNDFVRVLAAGTFGTIRLTPIPEPGTGLLFAAGLVTLACRKRLNGRTLPHRSPGSGP